MKRVLIISPYFPPSNAADMQRVRMSLPYFKSFGWDCEVVAVDESFSLLEKDALLIETLPADIKIHKIPAKGKSGSIAMRSYRPYRQFVDGLLSREGFDLIYFSTTQFPVCALGGVWKKKFHVPYVIDMQDPWHAGRYANIAKRNLKYRVMYALHGFFERKAMKGVDGLISVSQKYLDDLANRYPRLTNLPAAVIPFGAFKEDLNIAVSNAGKFQSLLKAGAKNIVYIGRGGKDLYRAITPLFLALKRLPEIQRQIKLYFIGTSYLPEGESDLSIAKLANEIGIQQNVVELPKRIGYYETLNTLENADALFIPGSDDIGYNASKIHPYILTGKPILAILNPQSPAFSILKEYGLTRVFGYDETGLIEAVKRFLIHTANDALTEDHYHPATIKKYSAKNLTERQCELFDAVLQNK